ncbi:hypothetical protein HZH66_001536 [Vespula vulgaris]|uniref:Muscleblind-like CCCH zinc finger domain-containing protein n=1 Tax=Vespula vulgaris TaxID=7454 RepID=A0A834NKQ8_VESVU|nr:hypothetical protein HZH66_001536 [Vespula vulgaris]
MVFFVLQWEQGRCNREKPPCKYFHPPQHLKDQLLINGRNHLALKNALMQQMGLTPGQPLVPGQVPAVKVYMQLYEFKELALLAGAEEFSFYVRVPRVTDDSFIYETIVNHNLKT